MNTNILFLINYLSSPKEYNSKKYWKTFVQKKKKNLARKNKKKKKYLIFMSVKYFDRRPPQRQQRRTSDGPATAATAVISLSILWEFYNLVFFKYIIINNTILIVLLHYIYKSIITNFIFFGIFIILDYRNIRYF
jgi:hypothetical protein